MHRIRSKTSCIGKHSDKVVEDLLFSYRRPVLFLGGLTRNDRPRPNDRHVRSPKGDVPVPPN